MEVPSWFWSMSLALFGLLFGSFANVLIWRFPRGESVAFPGSHCPVCDHVIRWYDNIPLISWAILRGRCRDCSAPISARYPLVELLSGVLWLVAGMRFGFTAQSLLCAGFFYTLLVLTFIDLDTYRLPNAIVGALALSGTLAAVIAQLTGMPLTPLLHVAAEGWLSHPIASALTGAALGAGLSGGLAFAYGRARGRSGLGMGDVKLLGAIGVFLGPYVLLTLFAGSILGVIGGIVDANRTGGSTAAHRIPFGPYLAAGSVLTTLAGPAIWAWYLSLLQVS